MRRLECDIAVVGGGVAGIAAAVSAQRAGARAVLIERSPSLGGTGVRCGVPSFCGFYTSEDQENQVVQGIGEEVLQRLKDKGEDIAPVRTMFGGRTIFYDPEVLKLVLEELLLENRVQYLLDAYVIGVDCTEGLLRKLEVADDEGRFWIQASSFVDASGDANLAHMAGCPTRFGDEEGRAQMATLEMQLAHVPRSLHFTPDQVGEALQKAYHAGYRPRTKMRAPVWPARKGDVVNISLPNYELQGLDSASMTRALHATRVMAHVYAQALREFLPGMERSYLLATGPHLGIRESRRIVCEKNLTVDHVLRGDKAPEERVVRCGWSLENHRLLQDMSDNQDICDRSWYGLPLGCLKAVSPGNLWCAGRDIGVDHETLSSVRVMGTCFATGQAAGVAAALTPPGGAYDLAQVRAELLRQGALI